MKTIGMKCFFFILSLTVIFTGCAHAGKVEQNDASATVSPCPTQQDTNASAALNYPPAKTEDVTESLNGYTIHDPYRWMETEGAAQEWVEQQNALTRAYLDRQHFDGLQEKVQEFFDIGYVGEVSLAGGRTFYTKRDGDDMEQSALFVMENDVERILVNPNTLDPEFKTALDWFTPSKDGKLVAYGLSKDGSENSTLYVIDVVSGKTLTEAIPEARYSSIAWLADNSGFYYTRYPSGDRYNRKAYFHKLGQDWNNDPLIFGKKRQHSDWTSLKLSRNGRYLLITEDRGWTNTDLYLYDTKTKKTKTLFLDLGATLRGLEMIGNTIYTLTNLDAPNGRMVTFSRKRPKPKHWKTIVAEGKWPIEGFLIGKQYMMLQTLENVSNHLRFYTLKGKASGELQLPTVGMVTSADLETDTDRFCFVFNSFFYPTTLYAAQAVQQLQPKQLVSVKTSFDPGEYVAQQLQYPSYDGSMINLFLVHRKDITPSPDRPALLYGYGGFQVNMSPYFSRRVMSWIERGGVYAVANIRGGGEYGEAWHQAGMKGKKFQVFKDFEYAMRYLIQNGMTSPEKLVIEGGSNGGLLVGAMMTSVPYLFAAGVSSVGLYDMVRYHKYPPGELWIPEYGNADLPEDTGYLWGYSPYHQIVPGVRYPAFFGHTADTDNRVHWVHTAKFTAALQAANASDQPILMHLDRRAGHGQGKSKTDVTKEYIDKFLFMFSIVGDPALTESKQKSTQPVEASEEPQTKSDIPPAE